jgi:hypothetical protein
MAGVYDIKRVGGGCLENTHHPIHTLERKKEHANV